MHHHSILFRNITQQSLGHWRSVIFTLNHRSSDHDGCVADVLRVLGNSVVVKVDTLRTSCSVFITAKCSVFTVREFLYQSSSGSRWTVHGDLDDGDETALTAI